MCSQIVVSACYRAAALFCLACFSLAASSCTHQTRPHPLPLPQPHPVVLQPIAFPYLNTNEISSVSFSPDGRRLAFGYGTDAEVTLWDMETGRLGWQRHVEAASGGPIQFEPHGRFLVAQFDDPDGDTPVIVSTLGGRRLGVPASFGSGSTARLESSGRFLVVSGSQEGRVNGHTQQEAVQAVEVWDTRTWRRVDRVAQALNGAAPETDYGSAASRYLPLSTGGKIIRALLRKSAAAKDRQTHSVRGGQYRDYPNDKGMRDTTYNDKYRVWVWETSGIVEVTDRKTNAHLHLQTLAHDTARMPAISPNGKIVAVPTTEGTVSLWNIQTGKLLAKVHCTLGPLRCAVFSPNSQVLAVAGGMEYSNQDNGVWLLDTSTYKVFAVLKAAFPESENETNKKDWSLGNPEWLAALPDLSYVASSGVIKKIRTPGRARDAEIIARFNRSNRVRAALQKCYLNSQG